jgi:hypothetical protein
MILNPVQQDVANRFVAKANMLNLAVTEPTQWSPYLLARTKKNHDVVFRIFLAGYNANLDAVHLHVTTSFTGKYGCSRIMALHEFECLDPKVLAELINQVKSSRSAIRAANKATKDLKGTEYQALEGIFKRL